VGDGRAVRLVRHDPAQPVDTTRWPATVPAVEHLLCEGLELPAGLTVLIGENGSGKSTIDVVLLVGFTLAYSYGFTGIGIHEWLGIGLGAGLLLHVTLHWDWVIRMTRKAAQPTRPRQGHLAGQPA
jgi:hypothetical protein